jgi:hypothetical protein
MAIPIVRTLNIECDRGFSVTTVENLTVAQISLMRTFYKRCGINEMAIDELAPVLPFFPQVPTYMCRSLTTVEHTLVSTVASARMFCRLPEILLIAMALNNYMPPDYVIQHVTTIAITTPTVYTTEWMETMD